MQAFSKTHLPDIYTYDSGNAGPKVAIMGGVHGNELCGVHAFHWVQNQLLEKYPIHSGSITLILGNSRAVEAETRYIHHDLNRLFGEDLNFVESPDTCWEIQRIKEIKEALQGVDFLLDIHSTTSPTVPLTCSAATDSHLSICKSLPVQYMTTNWTGKTVGMASDEYVDSIGGVGITIECGSHKEEHAKIIAENAVLSFLSTLNLIDHAIDPPSSQPVHIKMTDTLWAQSDHFTFHTPEVYNFQKVTTGQTFASDIEPITAEQDIYFVFPVPNVKKGEEAVFIGVEG